MPDLIELEESKLEKLPNKFHEYEISIYMLNNCSN